MTRLKRWASWLSGTPFHPQWLLGSRLPPPDLHGFNGSLLDIGAADGWLRVHLSTSSDYVSLDYPATGAALYDARPMVFADAAMLPFADASFDAVACLEVLEHVPHPGRVLGEVRRVLKPGGSAYFSMPFLYPLHDVPYDFSRWTEAGWRQRAADHGFLVTRIKKRTHSLRTAGLMACLAIAGATSNRSMITMVLALPLVAVVVLAINCASYLASLLVPDWDAMGTGYDVTLSRH